MRANLSATTPGFHALPVDRSFSLLASSDAGLSGAEARIRLARHGANVIRVAKPTPAWRILVQQFRGVVVLLLAVAAVFSLLAGDALDAAAITVVLLINTVLGFTTEYRARQAMHALLALEAPQATVLRDGALVEVAARDIVPGDVIEIEAGHAVPADARVFRADDLRINEAALTGESAPSIKSAEPVLTEAGLPDRSSMVYAGTIAAAGSGRALVTATGMKTQVGHIGELVSGVDPSRTPLEHRLDALGKRLAWLALLAGAVVAGLGLVQGVPTDIVVQTAIALAIAAVPEGLPAVATIALAVGVRRMARRNALVRRLPSVETLGAVGVVCSDKTGTLTAGEMTLTAFWLNGIEIEVTGSGYGTAGGFLHDGRDLSTGEFACLDVALRAGALANRAGLASNNEVMRVHGDATEAAFLVAAFKAGITRETLITQRPEVGHIPFSSDRMWMATFHRATDERIEAQMKGAADRMLDFCDRVATIDGETALDDTWHKRILEQNRIIAARGLRVLGLARGVVAEPDEGALHHLVFLGLAALIDPPAIGVQATIRTLHEAGIRTVMITGDQQPTALAVARELGIIGNDEQGLDGRQLTAFDAAERNEQIPKARVFSRVSPEQKLQIIEAFQESGDIVAMLGDGVNDAAALKKADIGVAMGIRGTDVAREVAGIVLRDDRFSTIEAAVEQGRIIYDNIRKFVFYLFSCNLAEVLLLVGAGLVGLPVPLTPLQILWLNIVTDTFPALALAFEPAESDVMKRSPRDPSRAILTAAFLRAVGFYGVLMAGSAGAALVLAGDDPARGRTIAFMTLALAQAFHLGNARSMGPVLRPARAFANRFAIGAVALVIGLQLLAVYLPPLAAILDTVPLDGRDWIIILPLSILVGVIGQSIRLLSEKRTTRLHRAHAG
jgi:Ca2+-transporting ATPase